MLKSFQIVVFGEKPVPELCIFFQGVLLEHREKEFGDKVSRDAVLDAVKKIEVQPSDRGE